MMLCSMGWAGKTSRNSECRECLNKQPKYEPRASKINVMRRTEPQPMQHKFVLRKCSTDNIELRTEVLSPQPFAAPLFMTYL